jgi:hypothetical protein
MCVAFPLETQIIVFSDGSLPKDGKGNRAGCQAGTGFWRSGSRALCDGDSPVEPANDYWGSAGASFYPTFTAPTCSINRSSVSYGCAPTTP